METPPEEIPRTPKMPTVVHRGPDAAIGEYPRGGRSPLFLFSKFLLYARLPRRARRRTYRMTQGQRPIYMRQRSESRDKEVGRREFYGELGSSCCDSVAPK